MYRDGPVRFLLTTAAAAIAVIAVSAEAPARRATVSGIVISAKPPARPVARAVVTLGPAGAATSRAVLTDDRGGFEFRDIAAGQYPVTASKAGYLAGAFGAAIPGVPACRWRCWTGVIQTGWRSR